MGIILIETNLDEEIEGKMPAIEKAMRKILGKETKMSWLWGADFEAPMVKKMAKIIEEIGDY